MLITRICGTIIMLWRTQKPRRKPSKTHIKNSSKLLTPKRVIFLICHNVYYRKCKQYIFYTKHQFKGANFLILNLLNYLGNNTKITPTVYTALCTFFVDN